MRNFPPCSGSRRDPQPVLGLADVGAERRQFGGERGQPVGLVAAQVRHSGDDRRSLGEAQQRRDHRRQLADVVQIQFDAGDRAAAGDRQAARVEFGGRAQDGRQAAQPVPGLRRPLRPARDPHRAAGRDRGGDERRRRREVRLDDVLGTGKPCRVDVELGALTVHSGPEPAEHLDGHRDMRFARHLAAHQAHGDTLLERGPGEQQRGQELARRRGVQIDPAAPQTAFAVDGEGRCLAAVVVDAGAEVAQRLQQRPDGTAADGLVAVEQCRAGAQRGERGGEPGDRARVAEFHPDGLVGMDAAGAERVHEVAADAALRVGAEGVDGAEHEARVPGVERGPHPRRRAGERGEDVGPVGDRLRTGDADVRVERAFRDRCGPGVVRVCHVARVAVFHSIGRLRRGR